MGTVNLTVSSRLSIPTNLLGAPGSTVVVPVNIDNPNPGGSGGLTAATLAIDYDPTVFTVGALDVQLGTVTSGNALQEHHFHRHGSRAATCQNLGSTIPPPAARSAARPELISIQRFGPDTADEHSDCPRHPAGRGQLSGQRHKRYQRQRHLRKHFGRSRPAEPDGQCLRPRGHSTPAWRSPPRYRRQRGLLAVHHGEPVDGPDRHRPVGHGAGYQYRRRQFGPDHVPRQRQPPRRGAAPINLAATNAPAGSGVTTSAWTPSTGN